MNPINALLPLINLINAHNTGHVEVQTDAVGKEVLDKLCDLYQVEGEDGLRRIVTFVSEKAQRESAEHNGYDADTALQLRDHAVDGIVAYVKFCTK